MEYLANPFNHSINPHSNDGICGLLNMASLYLFYYILCEMGSKLEDIQRIHSRIHEINFAIPDIVFDNVFDDVSIDDKIKINLTSLLELNSLERQYILFYIFKKHGTFDDKDGNKDINTFVYYKTMLNDWRNIYFVDDYFKAIMNLDERLENDYQIVIGNVICDCNMAHVRFLSWLYYSGIYQYLEDNVDIKKSVLNEMNSRKLLNGNLFLKYHLYLIETDKMDKSNELNNIEENEEIAGNEKTDVNEGVNIDKSYEIDENILATIEEESTDKDELSDNVDEKSSEKSNEESSEESSEDTSQDNDINDSVSHGVDNDDELLNRNIAEELDEINETTFAGKLFITVKNITIRSVISTWKIIKEEVSELFHPVLG